MLCEILTATHYEHLERILKVGTPHQLVEYKRLANHKAFLEAGNHGSTWQKLEVLGECANQGIARAANPGTSYLADGIYNTSPCFTTSSVDKNWK